MTIPTAPARFTVQGRVLPLLSPARVYVCGITPYDVTHLGHAATFVWADALCSVLRLASGEVEVCRNVTDVDDVLTRAAAERRSRYDELAVTQEHLFERDMAALRVRPPAHTPRAHRYVGRVVQLAAALIETGHAYNRGGSVYFRGRHDAELAGHPEPAPAAEHGEQADDPLREDPFDVAVWRHSAEGDPAWPSPWGPGRPGWHAECAAIATSVLGLSVDLVVGGADLSYPHHCYQAAMAQAATGVTPFSRALLPVGAVRVAGAKMAKSAGNLVLVSELLDAHPAAAIRLLLLDRAWADGWDFDPTELKAAAVRIERLYSAAGRPTGVTDSAVHEVGAALLSDLDTRRALAVAEEAGGEAARLVLRTLALG
ncbi:MAG: cysteine--tRNA ligase [Actinomycetota bacterium]|nr:cysteine--tRNA ligase [Actinomycetota bacterium]